MKDEFKVAMMNEFEMKDLGLMKYFLGMEVYQDKDEIFICQEKYAKDMFKKFDMANCKPLSTPIVHGVTLCRDDGAKIVDETLYMSIVGSLIFLTHTRADIAYLVSLVARYMKSRVDFGIHYSFNKFELLGFSDSD